MAVSVVQNSGKKQGNNVASASGSFASLPAAGNCVMVPISINHDPSHANTSVTDNQSNTYTKQAQMLDNKNQADLFADFSIGSPSGTFTVTVSPAFTSNNYITFVLLEISGLQTTSVLDQTATANIASPATSTTVGPTGTTAQADELVVAVLSTETGDTNLNLTVPSGYTEIATEQNGNSLAGHQSAYKIVTATGTQSATWTHDGTANTGSLIATFKAAAAGGSASRQALMLLGMGR